MANISEALTNEFEAQKTVYLKGNQQKGGFTGTYLMRKDNQYVFIHHLHEYLSQIEFRDSPNHFTEEHENENMIPCSKMEFMEAFNEAMKVINSKL